MYLNPDEYKGNVPAEELEPQIKSACRAVDSLTFNRIVRRGFENLTEFQQELVKEAVQKHIDFVYDNAEILNSPLKSYSINGVSMSMDTSKVVTIGSVTTTGEVYDLLMQTGLCYRGLDR